MAKNDRGLWHDEAGNTVPGLVLEQYDTNGAVVVPGAGEAAAVTHVDIVLLGWASSKLKSVVVGTGERQFEFTDVLTP